jgi:hypothetical protein
MTTTVADRITRLSAVSVERLSDPDLDLPGSVGPGQILPDELLSVAGLDVELTPEQSALLAREEVASILDAGIRFESVLTAGFSMQIVARQDLTDPRVTYMLHELGEETRHSRLFIRLLDQLRPAAKSPFRRQPIKSIVHLFIPVSMTMHSLFCVLVLAGEEIPDLLQKLASEDPRTDPFVRDVNRYHRREEARHLAFARMTLPELWRQAGFFERLVVRHFAPFIVTVMFDGIVHPGVYRTVGLRPWSTWRKAKRSAHRTALRQRALRPILDALRAAGAFPNGVTSRAWARATGTPRSRAGAGAGAGA